jgi:hypothetical protein
MNIVIGCSIKTIFRRFYGDVTFRVIEQVKL